MTSFLARQPILTADHEVFGYELLARPDEEDDGAEHDDRAQRRGIRRGLLVFQLQDLAAGKRAFINFTREALFEDWIERLPVETTVIELLETIGPDEEVLAACRRLKDRGFLIALDDFVDEPRMRALVELADIVKVDFLDTCPEERAAIVARHGDLPLRFLAEKVETREQKDQALALGYSLFQGFFFHEPEVIGPQGIPLSKRGYLRLLEEVARPVLDHDSLEMLLGGDDASGPRLLAHLGSAGPVRDALRRVSEDELRRSAALVALAGLGADKPDELVRNTLVRARLAANVASLAGLSELRRESFLLGLLSPVDALVDRSMRSVLTELALPRSLGDALAGFPSPLNPVLLLVLSYERADWTAVNDLAQAMEISPERLPELYAEAVKWADGTMERM